MCVCMCLYGAKKLKSSHVQLKQYLKNTYTQLFLLVSRQKSPIGLYEVLLSPYKLHL